LANTADAHVRAYGWELHSNEAGSDKFYRVIVFLAPEPGVIYVYGKRGQTGNPDVKLTATAQDAINEACNKTREKQRKYELSRDFTPFDVPADYATPGSRKDNAQRISTLFGRQAERLGTALPIASRIP
jgi:predicted DNA-binding WGR domain protein